MNNVWFRKLGAQMAVEVLDEGVVNWLSRRGLAPLFSSLLDRIALLVNAVLLSLTIPPCDHGLAPTRHISC